MSESLRLAKHKDWATHQLYQHLLLAEMGPAIQSLQAPLFRMTQAGRCLSVAGLAARLELHEKKVMALLALHSAERDNGASMKALEITQASVNCLQTVLDAAFRSGSYNSTDQILQIEKLQTAVTELGLAADGSARRVSTAMDSVKHIHEANRHLLTVGSQGLKRRAEVEPAMGPPPTVLGANIGNILFGGSGTVQELSESIFGVPSKQAGCSSSLASSSNTYHQQSSAGASAGLGINAGGRKQMAKLQHKHMPDVYLVEEDTEGVEWEGKCPARHAGKPKPVRISACPYLIS